MRILFVCCIFFVLSLPTDSFSLELKFSTTDQHQLITFAKFQTSLRCHAEGSNIPENVYVEWHLEEDQKKAIVYPTGQIRSNIYFSSPTVSDSGQYRCVARQDNSVIESKTINITFIKAPEFMDNETEQHPEEGTDAKLSCKIENIGDSIIFWRFGAKTIKEGGPRVYKFEDDGQTLLIPQFMADKDDGLYQCYVNGLNKFFVKNITVTAYEKPKIVDLETSENIIAYEGQSVDLTCLASGRPSPTYQWTRQKDDSEALQNSERYTIADGNLRIKSVLPLDKGTYRCSASNSLATASTDRILDVFEKPKIEAMEDITKDIGERVEMTCKYSGNGTISVKWVHMGSEYKTSADTSSADNVLEQSGNEMRRKRRQESRNASEADEDGDEEDADGDSQKSADSDNDSHITVTKTDNSLTLTIDQAKQEHSGGYQCVTENDAGITQQEIKLSIRHQPIITSSSGLTKAVRGREVALYCEVSAVPDPDWTWYNELNQVIKPDGDNIKIQTGPHNLHSQLIFSQISTQQFGSYRCVANNSVGTPADKEIKVVETVIPNIPTNINCTANMYPNYAICKIPYSDVPIGRLPDTLTFKYVKNDEAFDDSNLVRSFTTSYDSNNEKEEYIISGLEPETRYKLRISAENEAGTSEYSDDVLMETSEPKVPEMPAKIDVDCNEKCLAEWTPSNDMGAPIQKYRVYLEKLQDEKTEDIGDSVQMKEFDSMMTPLNVDLSQFRLAPLTDYRLRVSAVNEKGEGEAGETTFKTLETTASSLQAAPWGSTNLILTIAFILLFLLLVADLICFAANRCGIIACFCSKCFGRNVRNKREKDLEQANKSETNRLLSETKTNSRSASNSINTDRSNCKSNPHSTAV